MLGTIRKKLSSLQPTLARQDWLLLCPICDRAIPDSQKDAHHLVPKSKGGKATEYLHRICHKQIHALFTETELANHLNNATILREHPDMQKFIRWIRTKPNSFYEKTRKSAHLKSN
jgi:hypothetical protein